MVYKRSGDEFFFCDGTGSATLRYMIRVILASRSPRRQKILNSLGLVFDTVFPEVNEIDDADNPVGMVCENAWRKWNWCHQRFPAAAVIAADTTVEIDGHCLGKPGSREEAFAMLKSLSGRMQMVHTGVVLALPHEELPTVSAETSEVIFRELSDAVINAYLDAVNPLDRAGAYDIDCRGEWIIREFKGSRTNIMGLPAERVKEWMKCSLAL